MIAAVLLLTVAPQAAPSTPSSAAPAVSTRTQQTRGAVTSRGPQGSILGTADPQDDGGIGGTFAASSSGGATAGTPSTPNAMIGGPNLRFSITPVARIAGLFEFQIENTVSGWFERAIFVVPRNLPSTPPPLLLCFHGFGSSPYDIPVNTTFVQECHQRGWYLLAPLGATTKSFSSIESQLNTEEVLEYFGAVFDYDPERIYAVGFSMGGGAAVNYAARHLDPAGPMIAAAVNHTGSTSLRHVYHNEYDDRFDPPLDGPDILEFWHGGTPEQFTFSYNRSSVIDVDPFTDTVLPNGDLARNLTHVPVHNWRVETDLGVPYAGLQTDLFHGHLQSIGGNSTLTVVPGTEHHWSTMDETVICNWLALQSLTMPTSGTTLMDRDARYFFFDAVQDVPNAFSNLAWAVDEQTNSLSLLSSSNLRMVRVHLAETALDPGNTMFLQTNTADGSADEIRLRGYPSVPSQVARDGSAYTGWVYNAPAQELILLGTDSAVHNWAILP